MKHLKLFFALFAMLALGVGNAWAEEATFAYADYKGKGTQSTGSSYTMEKSGILSIGNDKFYGNTSYAHFYANGTITVTPATGVTITKIVLTASSTSYNGYQSSGSITASSGTMSKDGTTVTWTGSAANAFTLKNNKQIRWTQIVVTYSGSSTPAQKYELTYQAGSVTGTMEVEEGANLLEALKGITPVACDPTSTEPIGWSESEITTKQATAPTLLTDASVMPNRKHSVYYVFAKKETTGGGAATDITVDLSKKDQITTNTTTSLVFTVGDVTFTNTKLSGSTAANNYCPGTAGKTYTSTRTYNGHQVTIASANAISKIVITAGTNAYATAIQNATWTNATASASNTIVTITPNSGVTSVSFKPSATAGMTKVVVTTGGGTTTISDYTTTCSGSGETVVSLIPKKRVFIGW